MHTHNIEPMLYKYKRRLLDLSASDDVDNVRFELIKLRYDTKTLFNSAECDVLCKYDTLKRIRKLNSNVLDTIYRYDSVSYEGKIIYPYSMLSKEIEYIVNYCTDTSPYSGTKTKYTYKGGSICTIAFEGKVNTTFLELILGELHNYIYKSFINYVDGCVVLEIDINKYLKHI